MPPKVLTKARRLAVAVGALAAWLDERTGIQVGLTFGLDRDLAIAEGKALRLLVAGLLNYRGMTEMVVDAYNREGCGFLPKTNDPAPAPEEGG